MATFRSRPTILPDIITYRLHDKLVYVRPADNYEEALDFAENVWKDRERQSTETPWKEMVALGAESVQPLGVEDKFETIAGHSPNFTIDNVDCSHSTFNDIQGDQNFYNHSTLTIHNSYSVDPSVGLERNLSGLYPAWNTVIKGMTTLVTTTFATAFRFGIANVCSLKDVFKVNITSRRYSFFSDLHPLPCAPFAPWWHLHL